MDYYKDLTENYPNLISIEDGLAEDVAELLDVPVIDGLPEILGTEDAPIIAAAPRITRKR